MKLSTYMFIISLFLLAGCATQQPVVQEVSAPKLDIPPGIDTSIVAIADTIFSQVAVTESQEQQASLTFKKAEQLWNSGDSLWNYFEKDSLTKLDSIQISSRIAAAEELLKLSKEETKRIKKLKKKSGYLHKDVIRAYSILLMEKAVINYETAIEKNTFDINFRLKLVQRLGTFATRLNDKKYIRMAATEFEKIVDRIKDDHRFYYELGMLYFELLEWEKAFHYFEQAMKTIRRTAIFGSPEPELYFSKPDSVPLDTTNLVNYISQQALCKVRLYEDKPALKLFREAKEITPKPDYKKSFQTWIEWILWDDGNIRASELRDSADTLRRDEKYPAAKTAYLNLLPVLRTDRTFDQISWRIAVLDYSFLNNPYDGLRRMQSIIQRAEKDSLTGAPLDTAYQVYFDTYGTMCYNTGVEHLKYELTSAYIYFTQAANVYYNDNGKAYLQLALLSEFNPEETLRLCDVALKNSDCLDLNEKQILFKLFHSSYRKLGNFTASKEWFDKWKQL